MPNRINPIAQYMISLAVTVFAYAMYAQYAVPAIEGPPNLIKRRDTATIVKPRSPKDRKSEFAWLLPKDAWELESSNVLQTSNGKILFRDYKTEDDGQLVVFPFTMILDDRKSKGEITSKSNPPMVLRCMKEARIKFDKPLTIGASQDGSKGSRKMERAQLAGEVVIYRPPTPGKQDSVEIITRNVQIEKDTVSTLEQVDFQLGRHHGKGRNLRIELAHANANDSIGVGDFSSIEGIRRIELAFLTQLRLEPDPNASSAATETTRVGNVLSNSRSPIDITSKGPFIFDIAEQTAIIRKEVYVRQDDRHGDDLLCEDLTLVFEGDGATINPMSGDSSSMTLQKITAAGSPAVINARSRETQIRGQQLVYDVAASRVDAQNKTGSVTVANKDFQFDAREFAYIIPPDHSFGPLQAKGPGRMLRMANRKNDEFRASWNDWLVIRNDRNGTKLVQIDGNAKVSLNQLTKIDADQLQFWMWPEQTFQVNQVTQKQETKTSYQPARLIADGNVLIDSPRLSGNAKKLNATWPQPAQRIPNVSAGRTNPNSGTEAVRRTSQRPTYQELAPRTNMISPANRRAQIGLVKFDKPIEDARKFHFTGNKVDVQLGNQKSGSRIRNLDVTGNVTIQETRTEKPQDHPLKISGDRLRMSPQGEEVFRIEVNGSNAKQAFVDAEGLRLTGVNIHLDQTANKVWVEGAGKMTMQPPKTRKNAPDQRGTINVSWGGGMVFDGRTIYFEQDVIMNTVQGQLGGKRRVTKSLSQGLSVRLKNQINFKNLSDSENQSPDEVEVDEIVLVDEINKGQRIFQLVKSRQKSKPKPIVVENQVLDRANNLLEKQKFIVPKATINSNTGDINAAGPGTIMNHRIGKSALSFSKSTEPSTKRKSLSFLQVNFDDSLKANFEKNKMNIKGNVRTLYAPVQSWSQALNPDTTQRLPAGAVKLTCDTVDMFEWQPRGTNKPTKEVIASGNAHIYGDLYEATSDRVSYNEATDILVIEGTPRSDANLWYQQTPRAKRDHLVAGKILYRISDQRTSVESIKKGSFSPAGNPFEGQ